MEEHLLANNLSKKRISFNKLKTHRNEIFSKSSTANNAASLLLDRKTFVENRIRYLTKRLDELKRKEIEDDASNKCDIMRFFMVFVNVRNYHYSADATSANHSMLTPRATIRHGLLKGKSIYFRSDDYFVKSRNSESREESLHDTSATFFRTKDKDFLSVKRSIFSRSRLISEVSLIKEGELKLFQ